MKEVLDIIKNGSDESKLTILAIVFIVCVAASVIINDIAVSIMTTAAVHKGHTVFNRYGEIKSVMSKEAVDKMTAAELAEQMK